MSDDRAIHPKCPYCGSPAALVGGLSIYPHRPDLAGLWFWQCAPCDAWVGTHRNSAEHHALGRLANAELRAAKIAAHDAFDPRWLALIASGMSKPKARREAYTWLAGALGMPLSDCHIGRFDVDLCRRVVDACRRA